MTTEPKPLAVGYVCASDDEALARQRRAVVAYARDEDLALADVLADVRDGYTISQVVEAARLHGARYVLVAGEARMAEARSRVTTELEPHGAACVVVGPLPATARPPAARPISTLPRRRAALPLDVTP